jgi:hypothetical protein
MSMYSSSACPSVATFSVSISHSLSGELPSGLIKFTITFFNMRALFLSRYVEVAAVVEEEEGVKFIYFYLIHETMPSIRKGYAA